MPGRASRPGVPYGEQPVTSRLDQFLTGSPWRQYVYGYPHKTAYRAFAEPRPLEAVWANERPDTRFLYVHVPFCELRCGFCNLFTTANPADDVVERFLAQLLVEAKETAAVVGTRRYTRAAIGGGTPTYLSAGQLERLLGVLREVMGFGAAPLSVELSPATLTREKLAVLSVATRLSLGVQSFVEPELASLRRPQATRDVLGALELIREHSRAHLNIDLIYGMEGQTPASLVGSLEAALRWRPEELYLYPLYVRPLTFLGKHAAWDDHRLTLYRVARDWLGSRGYRQRSLRVFVRADVGEVELPEYHAEDDGMVGLGVGARSYTKALHYAHDFAVAPGAVRSIIDDYLARPAASFQVARSGFELDVAEQQRRWVLLSLLGPGSDGGAFASRFGVPLLEALPQLRQLVSEELAAWQGETLALTPRGLEWSDALGPWLFSSEVEARMSAWEAR
ncbi:MAG: STM4012 family radical SAM protein [Myxococcaceae bacterium]|nr:STM4012 family radical SAM protein [Myxococcaceae bacterium]